ncbi:MAG TPA: DinB family protein [Phycisphaerales bacterium]|nr:DinB family protein [Phycisphaerales bacterium]
MPALWPWTSRAFSFDFPVGKYPDVLARYRGTPARIEDLVRGVPADALTRRDTPGSWSAKENIGHLLDLEALWEGRLDDYLAGKEHLRAADITNAATHAAGHNDRLIDGFLRAFRAARTGIVRRLEELSDADWSREAVHPRLKQRMRLVDAIAFTCDHDDYHLARVHELTARRVG